MYCASCGAENSDNSHRCESCGDVLRRVPGQGGGPEDVPAEPPLAFAIVVTILCCWPFGIPAIVYAAQSMSSNSGGMFALAHQQAAKAKTWCWIALGIAAAVWGGYAVFFLFMMFIGAAGAAGAAGATP